MMNFALKTRNFVSKTRNCALKMINFAVENLEEMIQRGTLGEVGAQRQVINVLLKMMNILFKMMI